MKYLIVGLGNIGSEYADTRHNAGFLVADTLAARSGAPFTSDRYGSVAVVRHRGQELIVLKPSTYMNLSGKAVRYWMQHERIPLERVFVVVDDIALPFGHLRLRKNGSDGGHNGLKSIAECVGGPDYGRLRFGIGGDFARGQQVDYVLGHWTAEERAALPELTDRCADAILSWVTEGPDRAMNRFNTKK